MCTCLRCHAWLGLHLPSYLIRDIGMGFGGPGGLVIGFAMRGGAFVIVVSMSRYDFLSGTQIQ